MFIVQNTNHHVNDMKFCGGNSEDAIYQKQFTTLDGAVNYITSNFIQPQLHNDDENENKFCTSNPYNDDEDWPLSDKSIKNWDDMISRLKAGEVITQQSEYDITKIRKLYSFQIFNTDTQPMTKKFILTQGCSANHFETQTIYDSKDEIVNFIFNDFFNLNKTVDEILQRNGNSIYVDLFEGQFYAHYLVNDRKTGRCELTYRKYDLLFCRSDINQGDIEPNTIDQLRQWFVDGKPCTLFWSDRAPCHLQLTEVYVPTVVNDITMESKYVTDSVVEVY